MEQCHLKRWANTAPKHTILYIPNISMNRPVIYAQKKLFNCVTEVKKWFFCHLTWWEKRTHKLLVALGTLSQPLKFWSAFACPVELCSVQCVMMYQICLSNKKPFSFSCISLKISWNHKKCLLNELSPMELAMWILDVPCQSFAHAILTARPDPQPMSQWLRTHLWPLPPRARVARLVVR
jgi:hypothetical protein